MSKLLFGTGFAAAGLIAYSLKSVATTLLHDWRHAHGLSSGYLTEAVVKGPDGLFYEVWGVVCPDCGFVDADGFVGWTPTTGPSTAWTTSPMENVNKCINVGFRYTDHRTQRAKDLMAEKHQ